MPRWLQTSRILMAGGVLGVLGATGSLLWSSRKLFAVRVFGWPAPFVVWDPAEGMARGVSLYLLPLVFDVLVWFAIWFIVLGLLATTAAWLIRSRWSSRWRDHCCVYCNYDLTGNVSRVCPECGRAAPSSVKGIAGSRFKLLAISGLGLALLVTLNLGLDYGYTYQTCAYCGARSLTYHFCWYGLGGRYARGTREGPISKAIQVYDAQPCQHCWELYSVQCGSFLCRPWGSGRGVARGIKVTCLESWYPALPQYLQEKSTTDPAFMPEFKQAIQFCGEEAWNPFFDRLIDELDRYGVRVPDPI